VSRALTVLLLAGCAGAADAERFFREAARLPASRAGEKIRGYTRALELDPARPDILAARAVAWLLADRRDEALADFSEAIRRRPESDAAGRSGDHLNRALLRQEMGDLAGAEADLDAALKLVPDHVEARLARAALRRRLGRGAEADADLQEARARGAAVADGFHNEGVRLLAAGDLDAASRAFDLALQVDPAHGRAHLGRARILLQRRRFDEAAAAMDRAVAAYPEDPEAYYLRGNARLAAGRAVEAAEDFEKAAATAPGVASFLVARGLARHIVRRDFAGARQDFDDALRIDPDEFGGWYHRALLSKAQGDLEAAERDLLKAVSVRVLPEANFELVRVLSARGARARALELCERSVELFADEAVKEKFRAEKAKIESGGGS
jgi:tetratricopeptide (TPR) repeat protein